MRALTITVGCVGLSVAQKTVSGCDCKPTSEVIWYLPQGQGGGLSHAGCGVGPYEDRAPAQGKPWCDTEQPSCNNGQGWDFCTPQTAVANPVLTQPITPNIALGIAGIKTLSGCTCHPTSEVLLMKDGVQVGGGFSHVGCGTGPWEANSPGRGSPWCDTIESFCTEGWDLCVPPEGNPGQYPPQDPGQYPPRDPGQYPPRIPSVPTQPASPPLSPRIPPVPEQPLSRRPSAPLPPSSGVFQTTQNVLPTSSQPLIQAHAPVAPAAAAPSISTLFAIQNSLPFSTTSSTRSPFSTQSSSLFQSPFQSSSSNQFQSFRQPTTTLFQNPLQTFQPSQNTNSQFNTPFSSPKSALPQGRSVVPAGPRGPPRRPSSTRRRHSSGPHDYDYDYSESSGSGLSSMLPFMLASGSGASSSPLLPLLLSGSHDSSKMLPFLMMSHFRSEDENGEAVGVSGYVRAVEANEANSTAPTAASS